MNYAAPGWLATINPLVKILAAAPLMMLLLFTRGVTVPAAVALLVIAALLTGARIRTRTVLISAAVMVLFIAWMAFFFALLVRTENVAETPLLHAGPISLHTGALMIGLSTALRFLAMMSLGLLASVGTTLPGLRSALVTQGRVPYRFAYGVVATVGFVPRYRDNAATIRAAHRARGVVDAPGPIGAIRRSARSFVPLLADGARHAERMSLAMDSRGFGAYRRRADRHPARLRARDGVFVAVLWVAITAIYLAAAQFGLLQFADELYRI